MVRWEPGAAERLRRAAVELFLERGVDATTVAAIAERAGVTERTFFRYFADKREVLFGDGERFTAIFVDPVREAPAGTSPLDAVMDGIRASAAHFPEDRRPDSRVRAGIIAANPGLQERELLKMDAIAAAIAAALRDRGVTEPTATIAARSGVAVFGAAFTAWVSENETRGMTELVEEGLRELRGMTSQAAGVSTSSSASR